VDADIVPQKKKSDVRVVVDHQTKTYPPRPLTWGPKPDRLTVSFVLHLNECRLPAYPSEAGGIIFPGPNLPGYQ